MGLNTTSFRGPLSLVGCSWIILIQTGCAAFSPNDLAKPSTLTIENALTDVGAGFAGMKTQLDASGVKLGLYPCKVTVNLNVTSSATKDGRLVLDASTAPTSTAAGLTRNTVSGSFHAEQTNLSSATRGNTIVVEMYSVACTPKETLAGTNPASLDKITKNINEGLIDSPFSVEELQ